MFCRGCFVGAMFPVAHAAFFYIDPFYFTLIRYGVVALILAALLFFQEGKKAFRLEGCGVLLWFYGTMAFAVYNLLIFWGQNMLGEPGVMTASIMESLMPMISVVIVWLFYKRRPHRFTLFAVGVSFAGAILVVTKGDFSAFMKALDGIVPAILIFIAVVGWVVYTLGAKTFAGWTALRYSALSCIFGTATLAAIVVVITAAGGVAMPTAETIKAASPHLMFMIAFPGLAALLGWNAGVAKLSPINALLFINFVPVTTLAVSIVQGYAVTLFDVVGTFFIVIALVGNNVFVRRQNRHVQRLPAKSLNFNRNSFCHHANQNDDSAYNSKDAKRRCSRRQRLKRRKPIMNRLPERNFHQRIF